MTTQTNEGEGGRELALRAREASGLGQAAFARLLGLHHTTVWAWEHGHRVPHPRMRGLLRLVEALPERAVELLLEERGGERALRRRRVSRRAVLETLQQLASEARRAVPLDRLRAALADMRRPSLDRLLLGLEQEGRLVLTPPLFPACLSQYEREALLEHPERGGLLFVELTQPPRRRDRGAAT